MLPPPTTVLCCPHSPHWDNKCCLLTNLLAIFLPLRHDVQWTYKNTTLLRTVRFGSNLTPEPPPTNKYTLHGLPT